MKYNLYIRGEIVRGNCLIKGEVPTLSHFLFWYILLINGTMKEIKLSQQGKNKGKYIALVDDFDYEYLNQWMWSARKQRNTYYASTNKNINGVHTSLFMHHLIISRSNEFEIDHIDRNGLNNQRHNLRKCTHQQNCYNMPPHSGAKYLGVNCIKGKKINRYRAQISINRKLTHIGIFKTEENAALAYNEAAIKHHGEFAYINII